LLAAGPFFHKVVRVHAPNYEAPPANRTPFTVVVVLTVAGGEPNKGSHILLHKCGTDLLHVLLTQDRATSFDRETPATLRLR